MVRWIERASVPLMLVVSTAIGVLNFYARHEFHQYVSCSFAALMPQYLSNVILLQLVVCANGLGRLVPQRAVAGPIRRTPTVAGG